MHTESDLHITSTYSLVEQHSFSRAVKIINLTFTIRIKLRSHILARLDKKIWFEDISQQNYVSLTSFSDKLHIVAVYI